MDCLTTVVRLRLVRVYVMEVWETDSQDGVRRPQRRGFIRQTYDKRRSQNGQSWTDIQGRQGRPGITPLLGRQGRVSTKIIAHLVGD